jgi:hypothetical protein
MAQQPAVTLTCEESAIHAFNERSRKPSGTANSVANTPLAHCSPKNARPVGGRERVDGPRVTRIQNDEGMSGNGEAVCKAVLDSDIEAI